MRAAQASLRKADFMEAPRTGSDKKTIYLIRHGETEMNEYLRSFRKSNRGRSFVDPGLRDTVLTKTGKEQAERLRQNLEALPPPEIIVASPLSRALQTADIAFPGTHQRLVNVLCRERVWHSSDVGRFPSSLQQDHPSHWDFSGLEKVWWFQKDGKGFQQCRPSEVYDGEDNDRLGHNVGIVYPATCDAEVIVDEEPLGLFSQRIQEFWKEINKMNYSRIAVVAHWGVLYELTGQEFENCELKVTTQESG